MTSVERVMTYTKLESEPGYQVDTLPSEGGTGAGKSSFAAALLRMPDLLLLTSFKQ